MGTPIAYVSARFSYPGKELADSLIDLPVITTTRVVRPEVVRLSRRASRTIGSCRASAMLGRGLLRNSASTGRAMKAMARAKSSPRPALRVYVCRGREWRWPSQCHDAPG